MSIQATPFEILLLEDEPADAYLVKLALQEGKVLTNLHHVQNGYEGLAFLRHENQYEDAPRPDIILIDINMPRMNGYEFLNKIKHNDNFKDIPVIVLTTSDNERDIKKSYQQGASGYIAKPVDVNQFVRVISQLENYWFGLVRLPIGSKHG